MAIALISDIHANLHALDAVIRDIEDQACSEIICLGDVVGYGGDPEACVQRVRAVSSTVLLGNHDAVAAGLLGDESFNEVARGAIRATRELLSDFSLTYLASLPHEKRDGDVHYTHAHPVASESWAYIFVGESLENVFEQTDAWLMAIGHTHTPGIGTSSHPVLELVRPGRFRMSPDERYVYNVGSVGQPRDRDVRATWARLDRAERTIELRRVEYDVTAAQRSIRERGFPEFLADRLAKGM